MDQHDQKEREEASAAQWRGRDLKQPRQDGRTYERELATDEETTGDKGHLLQHQEILSDSESEAVNQVYQRQANSDDSDSELEEVLNEPERRKPQPGGFCEEGERIRSRVQFTVIKAPCNKDQE